MSFHGTYHPSLVTATVAAPAAPLGVPVNIPGLPSGLEFPFTVTGKASDGFFAKSATTDFASLVTGAEGNTQIAINPDSSGNFTLTLMQGTIACRVFSILFSAQRLIGQGLLPAFTFPITVRDNNCTPAETHEGFHCLIARPPDVSYGASIGNLVWSFIAAEVVSNYGSRLA